MPMLKWTNASDVSTIVTKRLTSKLKLFLQIDVLCRNKDVQWTICLLPFLPSILITHKWNNPQHGYIKLQVWKVWTGIHTWNHSTRWTVSKSLWSEFFKTYWRRANECTSDLKIVISSVEACKKTCKRERHTWHVFRVVTTVKVFSYKSFTKDAFVYKNSFTGIY